MPSIHRAFTLPPLWKAGASPQEIASACNMHGALQKEILPLPFKLPRLLLHPPALTKMETEPRFHGLQLSGLTQRRHVVIVVPTYGESLHHDLYLPLLLRSVFGRVKKRN